MGCLCAVKAWAMLGFEPPRYALLWLILNFPHDYHRSLLAEMRTKVTIVNHQNIAKQTHPAVIPASPLRPPT
eukprot:188150-Pleurochrysis_carterae.AAC.1